MNHHYEFFDTPEIPTYSSPILAMKPAIYFIDPPCQTDANYGCLGCDTAILCDNGLYFNCGYFVPADIAQCNKSTLEPDLPWYP